MLIQLCYGSVAVTAFDEPTLQDLLKRARANNEREGITGLLLYGNGHFVQIIEGEQAAVDALYEKIVNDPRHHQVFRMYRDSVSARDFGTWTMAFQRLTDFKPEFLHDSAKARALVNLFLERERTLTANPM